MLLLYYNGIYPSLQKVQCLTHLDAWQQLDGGEPRGRQTATLPPVSARPLHFREPLVSPPLRLGFPLSQMGTSKYN